MLKVTSYGYDDAGQMTSETNPLNKTTTYGYDGAGRTTTITDALGGVVTLGYDAASQLTSVTDPRNKTWTYGYNALGIRTSVTDPLNRQTTWGYNAAGALASRTDARGIQTSYGYDAARRQTSITYPGGSVGYAYNGAGERTQMTDPTGQTTYTNDAAGRVTAVSSPRGQITYTYDSAGRRASMTLPGNRTVTYDYNARGLLASLRDWQGRVTAFVYNSDGNRTQITRSNGVVSTYAYDSAGHVTSITHKKGPKTLLSFSYTYDDAGRRTSVTTPQGTESYTYDALGRLTQVSYPGGPIVSYTYDAAGNRKTETRGSNTTNYNYDAVGQLVTVGNKTYSYDANGNLLQAGSDSFTWDYDNRLTQAIVGTHTASYTYDGQGVRTRATIDGSTKNYLVDGQDGLPTIVDDGSKAYLHAGGVLSEVGAGGATQLLGDALGSVRGLANDAGSLVGGSSYEAFGVPRNTSGASSIFGFTGEPTDAAGLVLLRARSLDPSTGRFLSADSVTPNAPGSQGYNVYAYAANNPTTWTDPTGHFVQTPLGGPTVWEVLQYLVGTGLAGVETLAVALQVLVEAHPIAALVGFAVLAAVLIYFLVVAPNLELFQKSGSESKEGAFDQTVEALEEATDVYPPSPRPQRETDPSCPAPPGTIGPARVLQSANYGHGAECETHHIIQEAAVREIQDYRSAAAAAIVLTVPAHKAATAAQRNATIGGTYGAERQVAFLALRAAGVAMPTRSAALAYADVYFMGTLHLRFDSRTRVPATRWGYVG
jgi:RHS repeat-associated protein